MTVAEARERGWTKEELLAYIKLGDVPERYRDRTCARGYLTVKPKLSGLLEMIAGLNLEDNVHWREFAAQARALYAQWDVPKRRRRWWHCCLDWWRVFELYLLDVGEFLATGDVTKRVIAQDIPTSKDPSKLVSKIDIYGPPPQCDRCIDPEDCQPAGGCLFPPFKPEPK